MRPKEFKRWRKSLGLSQKAAADALGLKRRVVQYYEKGERDGKEVGIPKAVRLACFALSEGVSDYHGPRDRDAGERSAEQPLHTVGLDPQETNGASEAVAHPTGKKEKEKERAKDKDRAKGKGDGKRKAEKAGKVKKANGHQTTDTPLDLMADEAP